MDIKRKKIMVVDDEAAVRRYLKRALESWGYSVIPCESGSEAVGRVEDAVPDMVLLDLCMSGLDGYETLACLKRVSPATPVVLLTGFSDADEMPGLGADGFLGKPVTAETLAVAVARCVKAEEAVCPAN
jgi:CheY-like chemotaxis protein